MLEEGTSPLSSAPSSPVWPDPSAYKKESGRKGSRVDRNSVRAEGYVIDDSAGMNGVDIDFSEDDDPLSTAPSSPLWPQEDADMVMDTDDDDPLSTPRTSPTWPGPNTPTNTNSDTDNETISKSLEYEEDDSLSETTEIPATAAEMQRHALAIASLQKTSEFPTSYCRTRIQAQKQPDFPVVVGDVDSATGLIRPRLRLAPIAGGGETREDISVEALAARLVARAGRALYGSEGKVDEWLQDMGE